MKREKRGIGGLSVLDMDLSGCYLKFICHCFQPAGVHIHFLFPQSALAPTDAPIPALAQENGENLWSLLIGRAENCRVRQAKAKQKKKTFKQI